MESHPCLEELVISLYSLWNNGASFQIEGGFCGVLEFLSSCCGKLRIPLDFLNGSQVSF